MEQKIELKAKLNQCEERERNIILIFSIDQIFSLRKKTKTQLRRLSLLFQTMMKNFLILFLMKLFCVTLSIYNVNLDQVHLETN